VRCWSQCEGEQQAKEKATMMMPTIMSTLCDLILCPATVDKAVSYEYEWLFLLISISGAYFPNGLLGLLKNEISGNLAFLVIIRNHIWKKGRICF
jgi:hypothetical protein